jgi:hypothetical protein
MFACNCERTCYTFAYQGVSNVSAVDSRYDNEHKAYVAVDVKFLAYGAMLPTAIIWEDGQRFNIDEVIDVQKAASLIAGGTGIRYTIRIGKEVRFMFLEEDRWFVEVL